MTSSKKTNFDSYEQDILDVYEKGQLKPAASGTDYQTIALKQRAAREGITYQTPIGSMLHKYASGFLKEAN